MQEEKYQVHLLPTKKINRALLEYRKMLMIAGQYNPMHEKVGVKPFHLFITSKNPNLIPDGVLRYIIDRRPFRYDNIQQIDRLPYNCENIIYSTDEDLTPSHMIPEDFLLYFTHEYNNTYGLRPIFEIKSIINIKLSI